jgi:hypothetical protein
MSYVGEKLQQCFVPKYFSIDPNEVYITFVPSPIYSNPCGHALLRAKMKLGEISDYHYFHIPGPGARRNWFGFYDVPFMLNSVQFNRYLRENDKKTNEVKHVKIHGINKNGAEKMSLQLQKIMQNPYAWKVIIHNCLSFAEQVIRSSGRIFNDKTISECPKVDLDANPNKFLRFIFQW